jgi:hypothetical protein
VQLDSIRAQDDGVEHPGPLYFYLLAPLYCLSGCKFVGLRLGATAINLAALAVMLAVSRRAAGRTPTVCLALLLILYVRFMGVPWLVEVWTPWVVIMPFLAGSLLWAAVAAGRPGWLPAAVLVSSLVVQTQMGYAPTLLAMAVAALLLAAMPKLRARGTGSATARGTGKASGTLAVLLGLIVGGIVWLPPAVKLICQMPGNLLETVQFFARQGVCHGWREAGRVLDVALAAFPASWAGADLKAAFYNLEHSAAPPDLPSWYAALALGQIALVAVAWWLARRRGDTFLAALCLLCLAAAVVCTLSVRRIVGPIAMHYVFWMTGLGLLNCFAIGGEMLSWLADRLGVERRPRGRVAAAVAVACLLAAGCAWNIHDTIVALPGIGRDELCEYPRNELDEVAVAGDARMLIGRTLAVLQQQQVRQYRLRVVGMHHCGVPSGMILGLTKAGHPPLLDPRYVRIFSPRQARGGPSDGMLLLCDLPAAARLDGSHGLRRLGQTAHEALFWTTQAGPLEGRYAFDEEIEAFACSMQGFYPAEREPSGGGFRWSNGSQSALVVELTPGRAYRLSLTAAPLAVPGRTQAITVLLGGQVVGEHTLSRPDWSSWDITLPAAMVEQYNELAFQYRYVASPRELFHADDDRKLAVRFRSLVLRPMVGE